MRRLIGLTLCCLLSSVSFSKTIDSVLKEEGFKLIMTENGKDIYYRPKEVQKDNGVVYYSTTTFFTGGENKYGLRSYYEAIGCKEKQIIHLGVHNVPYIGKSSYKDLTRHGIKNSDVKNINSELDQIMYKKLCK